MGGVFSCFGSGASARLLLVLFALLNLIRQRSSLV